MVGQKSPPPACAFSRPLGLTRKQSQDYSSRDANTAPSFQTILLVVQPILAGGLTRDGYLATLGVPINVSAPGYTKCTRPAGASLRSTGSRWRFGIVKKRILLVVAT